MNLSYGQRTPSTRTRAHYDPASGGSSSGSRRLDFCISSKPARHRFDCGIQLLQRLGYGAGLVAQICNLSVSPGNVAARGDFWTAVAERSGDTAFRTRIPRAKRRGASLPAALQKIWSRLCRAVPYRGFPIRRGRELPAPPTPPTLGRLQVGDTADCKSALRGFAAALTKCRPEGRAPRAFTLIELLVVIAIMGIVAALLVGMASFAGPKKIVSRVKAELAQLEMVIASYNSKNGFYPPNSGLGPGTNQLYYELVGTIRTTKNNEIFFETKVPPKDPEDSLKEKEVLQAFGVPGFMNSPDPEAAVNFFPTMKPSLARPVTVNDVTVKLLVVPAKGVNGDNAVNTWNYMAPGVHNPNSYDLWAEVIINSKTNLIGNWK
jgi:prepilin-type N-terminal cleavage/methylation domain-containing protein